MNKALILGVTGQDGSYLAELLLAKGYEVHGMLRRSATGNTRNIQHLIDDVALLNSRFFLHRGDLADPTSLSRIIAAAAPDEIYNEADQDHVAWSHDMVGYSADITGAAVGRVLELIRQINPAIRFFQPCTSNMFGKTDERMQNEQTRFNPQSPYACAKVMAYHLTRYYREVHGIFACTAILFNHESPRRPEEYVTRKITRAAARIARGSTTPLSLGDVSATIDWGFAAEYMEAAWRMLQLDRPDDFVIATGEGHTVREWADAAFAAVGLRAEDHIRIDSSLQRPGATGALIGDITKAQQAFGFAPATRFHQLVRMMVDADVAG